MIDEQASGAVALAQGALQLDQLAGSLVRRLGGYAIPEPLKNTGISLSADAVGRCLVVQAHGKTLKSQFEHVWLDRGENARKLVGRLQFRLLNEEQKPGKIVHEVLFDALGNASLDGVASFSENINANRDDSAETCRRIVLMLIARIHQSMDTVTLPN